MCRCCCATSTGSSTKDRYIVAMVVPEQSAAARNGVISNAAQNHGIDENAELHGHEISPRKARGSLWPNSTASLGSQLDATRSRIAAANWSGACSGIQCVMPASSTNRYSPVT
jgi:hypothetical protein